MASKSTMTLDWPPTVNHYYTVARGRKILSKKGRDYKERQAWLMKAQGVERCADEDWFRVHITACPPDRRRRDLDNILKAVLDCLTEYGAITDDSRIDELSIRRAEPTNIGLVEVTVYRSER
jgi:crossover junction endodeoxyribonuclease RusA